MPLSRPSSSSMSGARPSRRGGRSAVVLAALAALAVAALGACGSGSAVAEADGAAGSPAAATATTAPGPEPTGPAATARARTAAPKGPVGVPGSHVHGLARDPGSGSLVVATHEGLIDYRGGVPRQVGPVIDLMGFTVAGANHYFASGHPGPGADLPAPVGLIETTDGGRTWRVLSRGGESDFHALTASGDRVVGFDGALRVSTGGRTWKDGALSAQPASLAVSSDGRTVLATTAAGVQRSTDAGSTWQKVDGAPLLLLVDWADGSTVAGLTPEGALYLSTDGGLSWEETGAEVGSVQALSAAGSGAGVEVIVATHDQIVSSTAGRAFQPVRVS